MKLAEAYSWEAEKADGTIIKDGADLTDCVRFSLRPNEKHLSGHDIIGVPIIRRFNRGFNKIRFNDMADLPCKLDWLNGSPVVKTPQDLTEVIRFGDLIRQKGPEEMCQWHTVLVVTATEILTDKPFDGKTALCVSWRRTPQTSFEYVYCVVCKGFRVYVRASDGAVLVTPEDYELYL